VATFLARRLAAGILTILAVTLVVFVMLRLSGDPAALLLPPDASIEQIQALRERLGLNQPLAIQYWQFFSKALQGDLGASFRYKEPSLGLVLGHLPATLLLAGASLALAVALGLPLGMVAAVYRRSWVDRTVQGLAAFGQSAPVFWIGMMLILVFAVQLEWFPVSGRYTASSMVLPASSLAIFNLGLLMRVVRSEVLDILSMDYVRTARAKGLRGSRIMAHHVLRNAAIGTVTIIGLQLGALLGGAVVTETVFAWPGLGRLTIDAIYIRDFPLVVAAVFVIAVMITGLNILIDVSYAILDPRIRY
jgi:peptide/nickel transport system permease protein